MFVWTTEGEAGQVSLILSNDGNQVTLAHIPESWLGFVCWAEKEREWNLEGRFTVSTKTNGKCYVEKDDQRGEGVEDARGKRTHLSTDWRTGTIKHQTARPHVDGCGHFPGQLPCSELWECWQLIGTGIPTVTQPNRRFCAGCYWSSPSPERQHLKGWTLNHVHSLTLIPLIRKLTPEETQMLPSSTPWSWMRPQGLRDMTVSR